jgi:hypothetical protein
MVKTARLIELNGSLLITNSYERRSLSPGNSSMQQNIPFSALLRVSSLRNLTLEAVRFRQGFEPLQ